MGNALADETNAIQRETICEKRDWGRCTSMNGNRRNKKTRRCAKSLMRWMRKRTVSLRPYLSTYREKKDTPLVERPEPSSRAFHAVCTSIHTIHGVSRTNCSTAPLMQVELGDSRLLRHGLGSFSSDRLGKIHPSKNPFDGSVTHSS